MRVTCLNCSSYDHSTIMRAGRSLRLHTTTEPSAGSAKCKPWSACGRSLSAARIAGAPFFKFHAGKATPAAVTALIFKNLRRDGEFESLMARSCSFGNSPRTKSSTSEHEQPLKRGVLLRDWPAVVVGRVESFH